MKYIKILILISLVLLVLGCGDVFNTKDKRIIKNYYVSHWPGVEGYLISYRSTGSNYDIVIHPFVCEVLASDSIIIGKRVSAFKGVDTLYFRIRVNDKGPIKDFDTIGYSDYYFIGQQMELIFRDFLE